MDFFDKKLAVLFKEWEMTEGAIRSLDQTLMKIRGLAITSTAAVFGVAVINDRPILILFWTVPLIAFWIVDALFKSFQQTFIMRDREIEAYLSSKAFEDDFSERNMARFTTPSTQNLEPRWESSPLRRHLSAMSVRNVLMIYCSIVIINIVGYVFLLIA